MRPSSDDWISPADEGWSISVWLQPGARTSAVQGVVDGCLKLKVAAPPVEGKANEALVKWIAERLGVPVRAVELVAGHANRRKRIRVACARTLDDVKRRLLDGDR